MLRAFFFTLLVALSGILLPGESGAAVLFEDDFESASGRTVQGVAVVADGEVAHSGSKALKLTFARNEQSGGMEVKIQGVDHVFTRWYDYYAEQFDFAYGMKIHRIRSFNNQRQLNDWDIVGVAWAYGDPVATDLSGINGMSQSSILYNGGPSDWGGLWSDTAFNRGRWYCVETEIKLNTPGLKDGEVQMWVDGNPVGRRVGVDLRGSLSSPANKVLFGGWYSNSAKRLNPQPDPAVPSVRYIDDVVVSTERVGCLPDVPDTTPPGTPRGVRFSGQ